MLVMTSNGEMDLFHIRVSDADRNRVMNVLSAAYIEGRITQEELDERNSLAFNAKTFGDLRRPLEDLLSPQSIDSFLFQGADYPAPAQGVDRYAGGGLVVDTMSNSASLVWRTIMSDGVHKPTRLPVQNSVVSVMGQTLIDLTTAVWEGYRCFINLQLVLADAVIIIPEEVEVINEVKSILAETSVGLRNAKVPVSGSLILTGWVTMGTVRVAYPGSKVFRKIFKKINRKLGR